MRIAALYDIHGNVAALDAVLEEIGREGVERIVIGGDVAWGPFPAEVLDRLRGLDALWVRGNADREVAATAGEEDDSEDWVARANPWCAAQLTAEDRRFLGDLPDTVATEIEGLGEVLFCHATPRSDEEIVTAITPDDELGTVLSDVTQRLIVCGHTHSQFDRTIGDRRLVNAGSVGLPHEDAHGAFWTILGPEVIPKRTEYDHTQAAATIRRSGFPAAGWFADSITNPISSSEATETFEKQRTKT